LQQFISLLFRCVHCIVCRNTGHYIGPSFVRDFLLHQIQAVFGAASVRLTRHHRHNVRGRYFCFDAINKKAAMLGIKGHVAITQNLRRRRPEGGQLSLRSVSNELAASAGFFDKLGNPYAAEYVASMLR
jgi:hypothetical protein